MAATTPMPELTREQWLAARWHNLGLGSIDPAHQDRLLRLGLQDTPSGSAAAGWTLRTGSVADPDRHVVAWSVRGAPHLHRREDYAWVRSAHRFLSTEDAWARMPGVGDQINNDQEPGHLVEIIGSVMREIAGEEITKPELSERTTARFSDEISVWCERCDARHLPDALFRAAVLEAGLIVDPASKAPVLLRRGPDLKPAPSGAHVDLVRIFVSIAPTTRALFAGWYGSTPGAVKPLWDTIEDELVGVRVAGKRYLTLHTELEALAEHEFSGQARLVPPHDAYLQGVDKSLLVPRADLRPKVWRSLSAPGAVLADGEVIGIWRRRSGAARLEVTVSALGSLTTSLRKQIEEQAQLAAQAAALKDATVTWDE